jgi:hypothetical protein
VFLELTSDPACSPVFEAERKEPNVLRRPPHGQRPLARAGAPRRGSGPVSLRVHRSGKAYPTARSQTTRREVAIVEGGVDAVLRET